MYGQPAKWVYWLTYSMKPICPRHPGHMGSHQTAGGVPAPRDLLAPLHGSHATTLIACGCDWAGVSLSLLLVIALWEPPRDHSSLFLAPCRKGEAKQDEKKVGSCSFILRHILAQLLKWLMLITITIGMCLMNGYSDFKVQTHLSKDKQVKE